MKSTFIQDIIPYTGSQLRSKWIEETRGLKGDAIVSFIGPAHVTEEHMVDLEDIAQKAWIHSDSMLHFIVEHFEVDLEKAVWRQRLMMAIIGEYLIESQIVRESDRDSQISDGQIERNGDDIFINGKKLSVSIATKSPVSTLIHIGLNISSKNTPVETIGLEDLKIEPKSFAEGIMKRYVEEVDSIIKATRKVREVS